MHRLAITSARRIFSRLPAVRLRCETECPTSTVVAVSKRRTIFTDEFLGVDTYQNVRKTRRLTFVNPAEFKAGIKARFEASGIQSIFSRDLFQLLDLVDTTDDLHLVANIIKCFLEDENRMFKNFPKLLSDFFLLCKFFKDLDSARTIWGNEAFQKSHQIYGEARGLRLCYLTHLYDTENYEEAVSEFEKFGKERNSSEVSIAIACLARIETKEALIRARSLIPNSDTRKSARHKVICAWLAMKLGETGMAYDILTHREPNSLLANFKLAILSDVGRLEDAFILIRTDLLQHPNAKKGNKRLVCYEVMEKLAKAVNSREDPDLKLEFSKLCSALDSSCYLTDMTLMDLAFKRNGGTARHGSHSKAIPEVSSGQDRSLGYDDCD